MTNEEYQKATDGFALYDSDVSMEYLMLGLVAEAGEVAGKMAKYYRGDFGDDITPELANAIDLEMGDILWFISQYCNETGTTITALMEKNIQKLTDRRERDAIRGEGDDR